MSPAEPPAPGAPDPEEASHLRKVARRAVVRITVLEYVLLAGAVALAVLAGGLVAWALARWSGLPLVPSWIAVSVAVFAGPALAVWRRERREDRRTERGRTADRGGDPGPAEGGDEDGPAPPQGAGG